MSAGGNKAVFLDRDGTINREKHYLYKVSDFEYLRGAVEGLKKLSDMGYLLVVITNQSGIARGYYTEQDYQKLDEWMKNDLLNRGVKITRSYYCPHLLGGCVAKYAKECKCRKPKTGLFWRAADDLGIDMNRSFAIGDKQRDLSICEESGVKGILLSDPVENCNKKTGEQQGKQTAGCICRVCEDWNKIIRQIKMFEEQEQKW